MSNVHLHSVIFFVAWSVVMTLTSGQSPSDHFIDDSKIPRLTAMLMLDSRLAGTRGSKLTQFPEPFPMQSYQFGFSPENESDYSRSDDERDVERSDDEETESLVNYSDAALPSTFVKRGRYHTNKKDHMKRGSLSDLIRRLMALKGNSFTNGRITMMRFGTGRRK